jgi:hypothetical protein
MSSEASLPHKFKCEDLVEGRLYASYMIGFRTLDLYVAKKPEGKDFVQFYDGKLFLASDIFYFWTSDLKEVPTLLEKLADADEQLEKELVKRAEKRTKRKK